MKVLKLCRFFLHKWRFNLPALFNTDIPWSVILYWSHYSISSHYPATWSLRILAQLDADEKKKKAVKKFRSRLKWLYLCLSMHEFQIKSLFLNYSRDNTHKRCLDVILTTSAHRSSKQWHQRQWRQLVKLIVFRLKYSFYNTKIQQL